jgi:[acyl-carrier-protein] S-malonyltransferase
MPEKIAFLFPGQGSQYIGMGQDLMNQFPEAKEIFDRVDDICQKPISKFCFEGPMDELTLTINLQPAITAINLASLTALKESGIRPHVSAGHSLGEYAALAAAGVISTYDALLLTKKRGELMHRESLGNPGGMAAIVGLDIEDVEKIVHQAQEKGVVAVANHNTAEQIVITGEREPVAYAVELVKEKGARAIPLQVSGAWHCPLMEKAVDDFRQFMEDVPFSTPETGVLFNATAENETNPEQIKDIMAQQLVSPVKWYDINMKMIEYGVDTFVEVGPKKVLSGLIKKNIPRESQAKIFNVGDVKTLKVFLEAVGG